MAVDRRNSRVAHKRAARIRQILREAAIVFAEKGYDQANLEEIAARLDLRGPSLYYYFSSKEDLLLNCISNIATEVIGRLKAIASAPLPALERLKLLIKEQFLIETKDYPEFAPLFYRLTVQDPGIREQIREIRRAHGRVFREVAEEAVAAGEVREDEYKLILLLVFGALAHVGEWFNPDGPKGAEQLAEEAAAMLMRMFCPAQEGTPREG